MQVFFGHAATDEKVIVSARRYILSSCIDLFKLSNSKEFSAITWSVRQVIEQSAQREPVHRSSEHLFSMMRPLPTKAFYVQNVFHDKIDYEEVKGTFPVLFMGRGLFLPLPPSPPPPPSCVSELNLTLLLLIAD